jgi:hypothetical protein|tara:strand:+ start:43 stop:540 length:498 start_codon:yes stop_codon:yes gene_type:complete
MSDKDLSKKIIKLDPLAEKLDNVGMTGGASKISRSKKLSKEGSIYLRKANKDTLKYSRYVTKAGKDGNFGSPKMSGATAKALKTASKEQKLKNDKETLAIATDFGKIKITKKDLKGRDEARKFMKRKRKQYEKQAKSFEIKGLSIGGEARGTGAAIRGKGFKGTF